MADPRDLYSVDDDLADEFLAGVYDGQGPVLLHVMQGFVDAGGAGHLVGEHLLSHFGARRLVTFDVDQFADYRLRRPTMTFDATGWSGYEEPILAVDLMTDAEGTSFLLLHGPEPDAQWERFIGAVRQLIGRFFVPLTVGVSGIPMEVPHTRPLGVTIHGTRNELLDVPNWCGSVRLPASVAAVLECRLGQWGHDAIGIAVHVPEYLAQAVFMPAARVGLRQVERMTGLALASSSIDADARRALDTVQSHVDRREDIGRMVRSFEERYDASVRAFGPSPVRIDSVSLPTADEIGAELEKYLAKQ